MKKVHFHRQHFYAKTGCGLPAKNMKRGMTATTHKKVTCSKCLEGLFEVKMTELKWIREELKFQREHSL